MKEEPTNIRFVQTSINNETYERLVDKCSKLNIKINEALRVAIGKWLGEPDE